MKDKESNSKKKPVARWVPVFDLHAIGKYRTADDLLAAVKKIRAVLDGSVAARNLLKKSLLV